MCKLCIAETNSKPADKSPKKGVDDSAIKSEYEYEFDDDILDEIDVEDDPKPVVAKQEPAKQPPANPQNNDKGGKFELPTDDFRDFKMSDLKFEKDAKMDSNIDEEIVSDYDDDFEF